MQCTQTIFGAHTLSHANQFLKFGQCLGFCLKNLILRLCKRKLTVFFKSTSNLEKLRIFNRKIRYLTQQVCQKFNTKVCFTIYFFIENFQT